MVLLHGDKRRDDVWAKLMSEMDDYSSSKPTELLVLKRVTLCVEDRTGLGSDDILSATRSALTVRPLQTVVFKEIILILLRID